MILCEWNLKGKSSGKYGPSPLSLVGSEQYIRPDVSICIVSRSLSQYVG